jgi:hypothetical protein
MIVGLIACDEMNDATRAKAFDLLRAHPRFGDHFERLMPRELSTADERRKNEWHFAHSGTWPDLVRSPEGRVNRDDVARFNRPFWHFINRPVFLDETERRQLEPQLRVNLRRDPPQEDDDPNMNVIQAVKNSSRIVRDAAAPRDSRSVHLCWLVHLAGDSHQPLHAASLFTLHRFRNGDRGGNYLEIEHGWKLHAFWDDQISTDEPYETIRTLATDLGRNQELTGAGKQAAQSLDIETWIDEGHALAKRHVYTHEVLQKIADREGHSHLGPLDLSDAYKADAQAIAERRAVEAGHRLAKLLEHLLE